jgi:hypothetical protein
LSDGVRLYFEVRELDDFCRNLQQKGFHITQLPRMMPWGWRHAYLNDPDGHEISLYWAGENRMKKTVMKAAQKAARARCRHLGNRRYLPISPTVASPILRRQRNRPKPSKFPASIYIYVIVEQCKNARATG